MQFFGTPQQVIDELKAAEAAGATAALWFATLPGHDGRRHDAAVRGPGARGDAGVPLNRPRRR